MGTPWGAVGRGFGLVTVYTTLSVRVWANINLIERNPPPRGSFFDGWFPNQESGGRGQVLFLRVLDQGT